MRYVMNSPVLSAFGDYTYRELTIDEAQAWLDEDTYRPKIQYKKTVDLFNMAFDGHTIIVDPRWIRMNAGDEALVFRENRRLRRQEKQDGLTKDAIVKIARIGLLKMTNKESH